MDHANFVALFGRVTGNLMTYEPAWYERELYEWMKRFNEDDLVLVVKHIRKRYEEKPEYVTAMTQWRFLIRNPDKFNELLGEAKAHNPRGLTERDKILMVSGRPSDAAAAPEARPAREILRRLSREEVSAGFRGILESLDAPEEVPATIPLPEIEYEPAEPENKDEPF